VLRKTGEGKPMSEFSIARRECEGFRWHLLTSVSALALFALFCDPGRALAASDDSDRPTVWIELGGQLEQVDGGEQRFAPSFTGGIAKLGFASPVAAERQARFSNGGEGKISFEPTGTDWIFSAAVRYGRSQSEKQLHTETAGIENKFVTHYYATPRTHTQFAKALDFADTKIANRETHTILDFQAGKEVGLGMFGLKGHSMISAGVRFAQFTSQSRSEIDSDQNVKFAQPFVLPSYVLYGKSQYDAYNGSFQDRRSFAGFGPSVTWDATAAVVDWGAARIITFDWGAKIAVLFGHQKATVHQTILTAFRSGGLNPGFPAHVVTSTQHSSNPIRSRSVAVPNLDGFAGFSFRYAAAKLSLGYRADFFFGSMDGGIDARKSGNVGFYGPFASVSIGIGD
jgi:hypothetical protein